MKTYLLTWNPKKWNWDALEQCIDRIKQTGSTIEKWRVISHKKIKPGDRVFLIRLGEPPKGIMGSGFVLSQSFLSDDFTTKGKMAHLVMVEFEIILNPQKDTIVNLNELQQGNLAQGTWTPQASGIEINSTITDELEAKWFNFLKSQKIEINPFKSAKLNPRKVYIEGASNQIVTTTYERNPYARKACIEFHGLSCSVCEFNFEATYGELGKDFIHVHHLNQISDRRSEYEIDPLNDLMPVCPNCHAMIHKRKEPFTIDEIQKKIKRASR